MAAYAAEKERFWSEAHYPAGHTVQGEDAICVEVVFFGGGGQEIILSLLFKKYF